MSNTENARLVVIEHRTGGTTPVFASSAVCRRAFTLVELLVVITIIGILVALLLPAVQAARESGRQTQCKNNLKQIAIAFARYDQEHGHFPTGGWGWAWMGDAERGFNWKQPGGWRFNILPYLEQDALFRTTGGYNDIERLKEANRIVAQTPLSLYNCPSRRQPILYPYRWGLQAYFQRRNCNMPDDVARSDYAANGGYTFTDPTTCGFAWDGNRAAGPNGYAAGDQNRAALMRVRDVADGIVFVASMVKSARITDGLSNTYCVGEKYLNPDFYATGQSLDDNEVMYCGDNEDTSRWTNRPPRRDTPGLTHRQAFGGPHPSMFFAGFCDGSVHPISFEVEPTIHARLGNRQDGEIVTLPSL